MEFNSIYIIYSLIFTAGFLALQVMIGAGRQATLRVKLTNDRLKRMKDDEPQSIVLSKMRKARGLNDGGGFEPLLDWIGRLVLQSGLPLGSYGIYPIIILSCIALCLMAVLIKGTFIWAICSAGAGLLLPILILKFMVKRRRNKAVAQLPDALDVIIRSLSAGHPVPVSMALVAREMPDPIGSEFGIAADEISFGASVSAAVQRISDRVGHDDFELFSAMIRLQDRTGGNLAALLASNAKTIRDRQKMRLRIKAASAEGRMSALILNCTPILLYGGVQALSPDFYGDVADNPILGHMFWSIAIWMGIGNLVMRKMINFKI